MNAPPPPTLPPHRIIAPHAQLAALLHPILVMRLDGWDSRPPAAISPFIYVCARGRLRRPDGAPLPRAGLIGPYLAPRLSHSEPGTVFINLMFRPGCLDQALGPAVSELRDQVLPLDDFAPPARVARMLERIDDCDDPADWVAALQALVMTLVRPRWLAASPAERFPLAAAQGLLFQPMTHLRAELGLSERQVERRVARGFGLSIRDLRRVTRVGFALPRFTGHPLPAGGLARLAMDFGFADQAHMTHEFRALTGDTPAALLRGVAGGETHYWIYRLGRRNFDHLFLPENVGSLQDRLFAPA